MKGIIDYKANNCDEKGNQKAKVLSKEESEGMKEIIKKVKDEEVVVAKTDKSHRLSLIDIDLFERMGNQHTEKDRKIDWEGIKMKQKRLTGLCRGISKALGVGENWGDR